MLEVLPAPEKIIFTHYQCEDFTLGTAIYNMHIYANGKARELSGADEAGMIARFCQTVSQFQEDGYQVVHWGQNRPYYGPDHICSRYEELTGQPIALEYINDINLSEWMKERYGENYLNTSNRLDKLAELNQLQGNSNKEKSSRIFPSNRLLLIKNIYNKARQGNLIYCEESHSSAPQKPDAKPSKVRCFSSFLNHPHPAQLASALKEEFCYEKGKEIRLLIEAMNRMELLKIATGKNRQLYLAMKTYFGRNICAYNSVFGYQIVEYIDKKDIEQFQSRLKALLSTL